MPNEAPEWGYLAPRPTEMTVIKTPSVFPGDSALLTRERRPFAGTDRV